MEKRFEETRKEIEKRATGEGKGDDGGRGKDKKEDKYKQKKDDNK